MGQSKLEGWGLAWVATEKEAAPRGRPRSACGRCGASRGREDGRLRGRVDGSERMLCRKCHGRIPKALLRVIRARHPRRGVMEARRGLVLSSFRWAQVDEAL